jgi:hypothetical protein
MLRGTFKTVEVHWRYTYRGYLYWDMSKVTAENDDAA